MKRQKLSEWIKKNKNKNKIHLYAVYKKPTLNIKTHID